MSNQKKITVTIEYRREWRKPGQHDYAITKIVGAPFVILIPSNSMREEPRRIGDFVSELEAEDLASRYNVITIAYNPKR